MARSKQVDAWFAKYDNPMKAVVMGMRAAILAADRRVGECIKWQAPTFVYDGNLASFYPKSKQHASLMFHQGAKIPGKFPRLEGAGATSRVMKIGSLAELAKARGELAKIVRAWCDWRDAGGTTGRRGATKAKRPAKPKRSAKAKPTARSKRARRR